MRRSSRHALESAIVQVKRASVQVDYERIRTGVFSRLERDPGLVVDIGDRRAQRRGHRSRLLIWGALGGLGIAASAFAVPLLMSRNPVAPLIDSVPRDPAPTQGETRPAAAERALAAISTEPESSAVLQAPELSAPNWDPGTPPVAPRARPDMEIRATADPGPSVAPSSPARAEQADPRFDAGLARAVRVTETCFVHATPIEPDTRVQMQTEITVRVDDGGRLVSATFEPPLSPAVARCVEPELANLRFPENAQGRELRRSLLLSTSR